MAAQMATLLSRSDLEELKEVVARWLAEAPDGPARRHYSELGKRLVELKRTLAEQGAQPTQEELELALTLMFNLAAQRGGQEPP
jgi:hypothetical protein